MKQWLKKITGIEAEEKKLAEEKQSLEKRELEDLKKKDPKAYATKKKEPWVGVLDTHVNKENVRNGFFELDWNKYFIEQLVEAGYGLADDPEEQIVDRWFRELCAQVVVDGDYGGPLDTGTLDIQQIKRENT
jgi:hypothetical protein